MPAVRATSAAGFASALVALAALFVAPAALAAFPGANGTIAFSQAGQVKVVNPDGSGETALRPGRSPAWSADGGEIAFDFNPDANSSDIWRMPANGSSATRVWDSFFDFGRGQEATRPAWSPDSARIAAEQFVCPDDTCQDYVLTFNADGTGFDSHPAYSGAPSAPSWSPDGRRIAFFGALQGGWAYDGLYTVNPDGSGADAVHEDLNDQGMQIEKTDWSPDGSKIVFSMWVFPATTYDIYVAPSGGGPLTRLTNNAVEDRGPVWSPDGTQIAFSSNRDGDYDIYRMNPDGSNVTLVTDNAVSDTQPSWQPIPFTGYARPKGASPLRAPLVTAFQQCEGPDRVPPDGTPNRTHGPPLAYPSCNPPVRISSATVGTPDATGSPAKSVGVVRYRTIVGAPGGVDDADLAITFDVTDVLCRGLGGAPFLPCGAPNQVGAAEDYVGELRATVGARITDKDNGGPPGAGTVSDTSLAVTAPCVDNADTTIGASCSVTTTAEAVIPGSVKEGQRAIWQMGQVTVYDGGPDGDAETPSGDSVFLRQGIFIP